MKLLFDRKNVNEIIFRGHVVMSRSETQYLESLIEQFKDKEITSVLEVGFGLGISATLIQEKIAPVNHHIVEIEDSLFNDCVKFCSTRSSVKAFHGDCYKYDYPQTYDLLFFDPYDFKLAMNRVTSAQSYTNEFNCEVLTAHKVLRSGGFLCHTFFGDCSPPELTGFTYTDSGTYAGPDMTLADGELCSSASLGYYTKNG